MPRFYLALFGLLLLPALTSAERYTFTHQRPANGQNIWQHVTVFANTMTTYEQDGNKISRTHNYITKEQIRRVTILDASPGAAQKVRVSYEKAQETRSTKGRAAKIEPQSVSGKTYIVMRPDAELVVFDQNGEQVPEVEAVIVRENMQFVGKANPIAQFLNGRTMKLGQELELPRDVAKNMLGWNPKYGQVDRVTLALQRVSEDGIASFDVKMVGVPIPELSNQTEITGQLQIVVDTCRTVSTNLRADLAVHEIRGPKGHTFTVSHEGQANIHTQARFLEPITK